MSHASPPEPGALRVLVVEDEWAARNYLVRLLHETELATVLGAVSTVEEARDALDPELTGHAVDAVFLDVHLAGAADPAAGLAFARELAARPKSPACVLATASPEHAVSAFEAGVLDYLLKPFSLERVRACLQRVRARRPERAPAGPPRVVARAGRRLLLLRPEESWAFEASERLTFVHTPFGRYDLDLSLTAVETAWGASLVRTHRNWLVNLDHVRGLERDDGETTLLLGGTPGTGAPELQVPVSRERAATVRELLLSNAVGLRRGP